MGLGFMASGFRVVGFPREGALVLQATRCAP